MTSDKMAVVYMLKDIRSAGLMKLYKALGRAANVVYGPEETRMIQNIARGYADSAIQEKPDILTVDEVSDLLKVTSQTIYNMIKDNRLKAIKIGREWRFRRSDIEELINPSRQVIAARGGEVSQKDFKIISEI